MFKREQSHTKGTAAAARSWGAGKCARDANKGEGHISKANSTLLLSAPLWSLPLPWNNETGSGNTSRAPGNWYVSTKVVSLQLSSRRGHPNFRRTHAREHTAHRCDSLTWLTPHTCLQAISHKSTVALTKQNKTNLVRPFPSPQYNCQYMASLNKNRQVTPSLKRATLAEVSKWKISSVSIHTQCTSRSVLVSESITLL